MKHYGLILMQHILQQHSKADTPPPPSAPLTVYMYLIDLTGDLTTLHTTLGKSLSLYMKQIKEADRRKGKDCLFGAGVKSVVLPAETLHHKPPSQEIKLIDFSYYGSSGASKFFVLHQDYLISDSSKKYYLFILFI